MNATLSTDLLIAGGVTAQRANAWAEPLAAAADTFRIDRSNRRLCGWLAQCIHESARLRRTVENMHYTTPERIRAMWPRLTITQARSLVGQPERLANTVYANRLGNGGPASGDGWRYRGRGLMQLTGRANYQAAAEALDEPYIQHPDRVALAADAALTAAWFWGSRGCNEAMDDPVLGIDRTTRIINGPGMVDASGRRALYEALLAHAEG